MKESPKREREEAAEQGKFRYNLWPRRTDVAKSQPSTEQIKDQRGPVRSRGRRDQQYRPYYKYQEGKRQSTSQNRQETKRGQTSCQNSKSREVQQQQRQEIGETLTSRRSAYLEVLVEDVNNRTH
ncbi:hypothetical protein TNCV_3266501 [Trichonephila clavipes]|nr:hypothetical protein TNCV_3266501 [Trichonephila clavipes]